MEPTADAGQTASPDNPHWAARAGQVGQPGFVVDEVDGSRDLWCFDPRQPIITDRPLDWLGFGGKPFTVTFADGQVVVTNDLTHLGKIPLSFHDQFPPSAVVAGLPAGDTYEISYADAASHNVRKVTTRDPGESFEVASRMSGAGDEVDVIRIQGAGPRVLIASFAGGKALPQDRARSGIQRAAALGAANAGPAAPVDFPVALTSVPARQGTGRQGRRAGGALAVSNRTAAARPRLR